MREHGELRQVLPQAAPMVLLDRAEVVEPGRALRAYKAVSGCEPCYLDLPAGLPRRRWAYPVSLLLESFGQAAAVLWASREGPLVRDDTVLMFAAARDCAFAGRAYPGDVVRHEVTLERVVAGTGFASGSSWVADRRIATYGEFVAVVRPATILSGRTPDLAGLTAPVAAPTMAGMPELHDIPLRTLAGQPTTLAEYAGRALLVVNVASRCGMTPQYAGLQALQEKYADRGFTVLGFPCDQFGGQEPGDAGQIAAFCSTTYGVTFPMFAKTDVNGPDRHPLYAALRDVADADGRAGPVRWNFEKFLVAADGRPVTRFRTAVDPADPDLLAAVEAALPAAA